MTRFLICIFLIRKFKQNGVAYTSDVSNFKDNHHDANLKEGENFFDLYIGAVYIDQKELELLFDHKKGLRTFFQIDFYDH